MLKLGIETELVTNHAKMCLVGQEHKAGEGEGVCRWNDEVSGDC